MMRQFIVLMLAALLPGMPGALNAEDVYPAAILPFQERGADVQDMGAQVTDLLFANLVAKPELYLVDREDLDNVMKELELNVSGLVNSSQAAQVGQMTGAKILLTGSVLQVGTKLYVVAKIIGTETTRVVGASVIGGINDELDTLVEGLAEQVAQTIAERAGELVAKPETREDRIAALKKAIAGSETPVLRIQVQERHVGQATIDPAAETQLTLFANEAGFEVVDAEASPARKAHVQLTGGAFSEFNTRHGNLISVKARVEVKAVESATGHVLATDRQTAVAVDLAEHIAGKTALQQAAAEIAERLLPKLVEAVPEGNRIEGYEF
jgi:TolB-like protein